MSQRQQRNSSRSWVWLYAERKDDSAHCLLCDDGVNNVFSARGGSTGSIGNHLKNIHSKFPTLAVTSETSEANCDDIMEETDNNMTSDVQLNEENTSVSTTSLALPFPENSSTSTPASVSSESLARGRANKRIRRVPGVGASSADRRQCSPNRAEFIHKSLTKMIAMSQLPLSFVSSPGFIQFMAAVEPNYKPFKEGVLKKRLQMLTDQVKQKIKDQLNEATTVSCTSDCWTSRTQQPYLTLDVRFIDRHWETKTYTLTTQAMDERHTAENLCEVMDNILEEWQIKHKTVAIVTDNASNAVKAVTLMSMIEEHSGLTCAAHSLQLAANKALEHASVIDICKKASKLVAHFHHSSIATIALENKQVQLGLEKKKLIQSVKTRWNSTFEMFERLLFNRLPLSNVLADRTITTFAIAHKFEITEKEWSSIEEIIAVLKPLQMATTVFCGEKQSPVSMVRPVISKVVKKHMLLKDSDSTMTAEFKQLLAEELRKRFKVDMEFYDEMDAMMSQLIASFLDPRYKDLEDETSEVREIVRNTVLRKLNSTQNVEGSQAQIEKRVSNQALAYLYDEETTSLNDVQTQFYGYLAEPQLRFDLNPWDWWKTRETKYPSLSLIAKRYLCIPATSASSERTFSTAGNIVTPKRNCLKPENVNMLVFLYQNQNLFT